jgi:N-acetylmuramoyl-L-alanine amidase
MSDSARRTPGSGRDGRRIGAVAAVLLTAALIAIALLGLLPHSARAKPPKPGAAAARSSPAPDASGGTHAKPPVVADLRRRAVHETAAKPLQGKVVGLDPGHNGRNWTDPSYINHLVWNGREDEACDTTGTETDGGYTEAQFNWNVAQHVAADLRAKGAKVVLTRHNNRGVGPCVTERAAIFRRAHVNVAVSIHGDGGPANGRGFAVLGPVKDGINNKVIGSSWRFDRTLAKTFRTVVKLPYSTYDGKNGLDARNNLAGENLARYPYALIECGNMRNSSDARLMVRSSWQKRAALGIADAITRFLSARH